ncbi:Phosphoinositide 3-kinase regulatory subunit 4 [Holothuria leucospilota]|uniref:non-specific serine/threonine protein kinase n=1 Tax=Holothuria leucospilota TaxID=206669 RepID=A0A9Q0YFA5_HOLLE|nr:Phosphoinositide 3-kinase regulatory subunit 4 [Holothuria leucospilota]
MGNQLTGIAPSQILPVEHYLTDVSDYEFDSSLGSTRFFKVAKAKFKEGHAVVKVFVIHDPSLPLKLYKKQLEEIKEKLSQASNCLPFMRSTLSDKAALLFRQYVRNNLYDRISTRPFLIEIEKKWIAFQLLCALNQAHKVKVCHGDIKSENVMVTGWNWVLLTDFASFKPTYLPADNPADFSFFFDTSRRRTCYIAPERFVESNSGKQNDFTISQEMEGLPGASYIQSGELTPSMDIFSAGCVIAELFTEGHAPFDLSQLLSYCTQGPDSFNPEANLSRIEDDNIRNLVTHMLQKDPSKRLSAERYLQEWRGTAFPEYFYKYLKIYLGKFSETPIYPADEKISILVKDLRTILDNLCPNGMDNVPSRQRGNGIVIILSLVTSCLRTLKFCVSKLASLKILQALSKHLPDDLILDRVIPYILYFMHDPFPRVRAEAMRVLTVTLSLVTTVPRSDANIFPEYILPSIAHVAQDEITLVKVAYAENVATLAEIALRFLEKIQLDACHQPNGEADMTQESYVQYQASYEDELRNLHEMIQQRVVVLLSDPENIVKQTLLENGITKLCVFFGKQKANDILLSHMITFLNDKDDWQLRGAFFDTLVGVAAYVGWQSSNILKPLLQQGLYDSEEFVICKAANALKALIELKLLQKPVILELARDCIPCLCHPNLWVRQSIAGVVGAMAKTFNVADVHCNLITLVNPYIKKQIIQLDNVPLILSVLKAPVSRQVFDYILKSSLVRPFFKILRLRKTRREIARHSQKPDYSDPQEPVLSQMLRKLVSQGMTEEDEDKIISLEGLIIKQHDTKVSSNDLSPASPDSHFQPGSINLYQMRYIKQNHAVMGKVHDSKQESRERSQYKKTSKSKGSSDSSGVNEDWKAMFGESNTTKQSQQTQKMAIAQQQMQQKQESMNFPVQPGQDALNTIQTTGPTPPQPSQEDSEPTHPPPLPPPSVASEGTDTVKTTTPNVLSPEATKPEETVPRSATDSVTKQQGDGTPQGPGKEQAEGISTKQSSISMSQLQAVAEGIPVKRTASSDSKPHPIQVRFSHCKQDLRRLVIKKRAQYSEDLSKRQSIIKVAEEKKTPDINWKPKGQLIAHLHEHKAAINRIQVSSEHEYFATASDDGTVKIWDCGKLMGKAFIHRSKATYNRQAGKIQALCFCQSSTSVVSSSDDGSIHVFSLDASSMSTVHRLNLDVAEEGKVVDITHFDTGAKSVLAFATTQGYLIGKDLRAPDEAWRLKNEPKYGLITSFTMDPGQSWMALGTSNGVHIGWDLRFQLPIATLNHPGGCRVRRMIQHPFHSSWIISSVQGNNEVSMWDMETGARQVTLWASPYPALSETQTSNHSVYAMATIPSNDQHPCLLTTGSDQRIRYWNLAEPEQSGIVMGSVNDSPLQPLVQYSKRIIDGTEVIVETQSSQKSPVGAGSSTTDDVSRRYMDQIPAGHRDIITDIAVFKSVANAEAVVTSSHDGVLKIWK